MATRRAVATADDEDVPNLSQAALWGLVRTAQEEHPGRMLLLDLDTAPLPRVTSRAPWQPHRATSRNGLAPRASVGTATGPLQRRGAGNRATVGRRARSGGIVLITGGTGTLGRLSRVIWSPSTAYVTCSW